MGELSATILAASQAAREGGGGQSNFLVPNGTFFAVLLIFLITLAVIAKWVVPPVGKVLRRARSDAGEDRRRQSEVSRTGGRGTGGLRRGDGRGTHRGVGHS